MAPPDHRHEPLRSAPARVALAVAVVGGVPAVEGQQRWADGRGAGGPGNPKREGTPTSPPTNPACPRPPPSRQPVWPLPWLSQAAAVVRGSASGGSSGGAGGRGAGRSGQPKRGGTPLPSGPGRHRPVSPPPAASSGRCQAGSHVCGRPRGARGSPTARAASARVALAVADALGHYRDRRTSSRGQQADGRGAGRSGNPKRVGPRPRPTSSTPDQPRLAPAPCHRPPPSRQPATGSVVGDLSGRKPWVRVAR